MPPRKNLHEQQERNFAARQPTAIRRKARNKGREKQNGRHTEVRRPFCIFVK